MNRKGGFGGDSHHPNPLLDGSSGGPPGGFGSSNGDSLSMGGGDGNNNNNSNNGNNSSSNSSNNNNNNGNKRNPFAMPSDAEIFHMRDTERQRARETKAQLGRLKIWEKTNTGVLGNRKKDLMREIEAAEATENGGEPLDVTVGGSMSKSRKKDGSSSSGKDGVKLPPVKGATSADVVREQRRKEKENTRDFIAKKREMFLIQMSLDTKRAEIKKLEELATQRETLLRKNEKMLEEDALRFDEFLKENDVLAVDAMKRAEDETKAKQEKVAEIKRLNAQINAIKSDMAKAEDKLYNCAQYKKFLDGLTPSEWTEQHLKAKKERQRKRREERRAQKEREKREQEEFSRLEEEGLSQYHTGAPAYSASSASTASVSPDNNNSGNYNDNGSNDNNSNNASSPNGGQGDDAGSDDGYSSGEDIPMYFTDPQQLLDIFTALEEKNLFLIQNSQETEEALEELKQKFKATREKMDEETAQLKAQIAKIQAQIAKEESRMSSLAGKGKKLGGGQAKDGALKDLHGRVADVYHAAGFDTKGLSILEMLTNIEARLESLLVAVAKMDPKQVHDAEKAREKLRRQRAREEKIEQQKIIQEQRLKKSLERSKAPVQKRAGKPVMFRSKPLVRRKKDEDTSKKTADEEEDIREFFIA